MSTESAESPGTKKYTKAKSRKKKRMQRTGGEEKKLLVPGTRLTKAQR